VFHSAHTTFHAPTELSGPGGMYGEIIRSNPSWQNKYERYDTVLIKKDANGDGMQSMLVSHVMAFLSFTHNDICYPCALVEWFLLEGDAPNKVASMWVVKLEIEGGKRTIGLVHVDCIVRAIHLLILIGCIYRVLCQQICRLSFSFHYYLEYTLFTMKWFSEFLCL
ncbi:hypothetical protein JAAARDRAFT_129255, partial [Jaapia argillacea MUCL 33604]